MSSGGNRLKRYFKKLLTDISNKLTGHRRWAFGFLFVVAAILAAFLAWAGFHVQPSDIDLDVKTHFISGTMARPYDLHDIFQASSIRGERLSTIQAPGLGIPSGIKSDMTSWFVLEGSRIALQSLHIETNARVQLWVGRGEMRLRVSHAKLSGTAMAGGNLMLKAGIGESSSYNSRVDLATPENLDFDVSVAQDVPSEFLLKSPAKWVLSDVPFKNLDFVEQRITGTTTAIESGVQSGKFGRKDDPGSSERLFEGERVALESLDARVELRSDGDLIGVNLSGTVRGVKIQGTEWNTSLLRYLAGNKIVLFWAPTVLGVITLLWVIGWSLRERAQTDTKKKPARRKAKS